MSDKFPEIVHEVLRQWADSFVYFRYHNGASVDVPVRDRIAAIEWINTHEDEPSPACDHAFEVSITTYSLDGIPFFKSLSVCRKCGEAFETGGKK